MIRFYCINYNFLLINLIQKLNDTLPPIPPLDTLTLGGPYPPRILLRYIVLL